MKLNFEPINILMAVISFIYGDKKNSKLLKFIGIFFALKSIINLTNNTYEFINYKKRNNELEELEEIEEE